MARRRVDPAVAAARARTAVTPDVLKHWYVDDWIRDDELADMSFVADTQTDPRAQVAFRRHLTSRRRFLAARQAWFDELAALGLERPDLPRPGYPRRRHPNAGVSCR